MMNTCTELDEIRDVFNSMPTTEVDFMIKHPITEREPVMSVEFNFQDKSEEILNELQDKNFEVYKPIR